MNDIEMTEKEICSRFKKNGKNRKIITVLAELNAVNDIVICEVLMKNGLLKKMPKVLREYEYCS
ncbi:MAG: hypothetical protein IJT63_07800 [Lachnospiraceae bacterium]|nr:hypothetical protein [Lachnospiraceae bacterium]